MRNISCRLCYVRKYSGFLISAKDGECIFWSNISVRTETYQAILEQQWSDLACVKSRPAHQLSALAFAKKNISWLKNIAFRINKGHLGDVAKIDQAVLDICDSQIWKVNARRLWSRLRLPEHHLACIAY